MYHHHPPHPGAGLVYGRSEIDYIDEHTGRFATLLSEFVLSLFIEVLWVLTSSIPGNLCISHVT